MVMPSSRSANANDNIKWLVTVRSCGTEQMAIITKKLPKIMIKLSVTRGIKIDRVVASNDKPIPSDPGQSLICMDREKMCPQKRHTQNPIYKENVSI